MNAVEAQGGVPADLAGFAVSSVACKLRTSLEEAMYEPTFTCRPQTPFSVACAALHLDRSIEFGPPGQMDRAITGTW
jgi:hypothetical protein